jgi:hypothetical protein
MSRHAAASDVAYLLQFEKAINMPRPGTAKKGAKRPEYATAELAHALPTRTWTLARTALTPRLPAPEFSRCARCRCEFIRTVHYLGANEFGFRIEVA